MHIQQLELHNFRSYQRADISFVPGVNVLIGPNGVGKTNVVEAVGYCASLDSHRVAADAPLIRQGSDQAIIRSQVQRGERRLQLEIAINSGRANRLQVSGSPVRAADFISQFHCITFAPEDLALVKGDPSDRRRLLDEVLVARAPRYHSVKADYERVVRQRTTLLRSIAGARGSNARSGAEATLGVWDEQLVDHGSSLLFGRLSLLAELGDFVEQAYSLVAPGKTAEISYLPRSFSKLEMPELPRDRSQLAELLRLEIEQRRSEELARGVTVVGPHRDDVLLVIGDLPAKAYASHGECWSLALALRLGSFELMRGLADAAGDPVLILDDVFAELDVTRRRALSSVAMQAEQTLITAAVAEDIPSELLSNELRVTPGVVSPASPPPQTAPPTLSRPSGAGSTGGTDE